MSARETWALIDSVRDRCYDVFVYDEKKRLHDLVTKFKLSGTASPDDIEWLHQSSDNLRAMGVSPARVSRRRLPRAKRGRVNVD
jgi:hypothetical protein